MKNRRRKARAAWEWSHKLTGRRQRAHTHLLGQTCFRTCNLCWGPAQVTSWQTDRNPARMREKPSKLPASKHGFRAEWAQICRKAPMEVRAKKKKKNTFINTLNNVTLCGGVLVMTMQDGTFNCLKATYYCCSCTAEFWTSDSFATDVSKVSWEDCKKKLKKKRQASQLHKNNPSNHHLLRISHILLNCVLESLKSPIVPQLRSTFLHCSPCAKRVKGSGGLLHQSELKHKT